MKCGNICRPQAAWLPIMTRLIFSIQYAPSSPLPLKKGTRCCDSEHLESQTGFPHFYGIRILFLFWRFILILVTGLLFQQISDLRVMKCNKPTEHWCQVFLMCRSRWMCQFDAGWTFLDDLQCPMWPWVCGKKTALITSIKKSLFILAIKLFMLISTIFTFRLLEGNL